MAGPKIFPELLPAHSWISPSGSFFWAGIVLIMEGVEIA